MRDKSIKKSFKNKKAITLISLVITIILMIIIAGVTISITVDDGLFLDVTNVTRQHQKENMIEAVRLAEANLENLQLFDYTKIIEIVGLIDKVKEVSDINDREYIITIDEENQAATIIHEKTGVIVDVIIDYKGNVIIDGMVTDDISNAVKPTISYVLDPPAGEFANQVTIKITAQEAVNGIVKLRLPDKTDIPYDSLKEITYDYPVTKNGVYKFVVTSATGRTAIKYVDVRNTMNAADIVMVASNADGSGLAPTYGNVNVTINYDPDARSSGEALLHQYSSDGVNWETTGLAEKVVSMDVNGVFYARYFNGEVGIGTVTLTINNIDREKPVEFDYQTTVTTNSIKVMGSTVDIGSVGTAMENTGVRGYQYMLTDNSGVPIVDWTTETENTSYTFDKSTVTNGLVQSEKYNVFMRAIDKAGNIREAGNSGTTITVGTVADSEAKIGVVYNPSTPTPGTVLVGFTDNSEDNTLTLMYQIGSTSDDGWLEYTAPVSSSINQQIYARLYDNTGQYNGMATATVNNIDNILPNAFDLDISVTTNSITVSGETVDTANDGCEEQNYGVRGYQYRIDGGSWSAETLDTSYVFGGLTEGTSHTVSMRAVDKAGNIKEATNKDYSVTVVAMPDAEALIGVSYMPTAPTNGSVTVTFVDNSNMDGVTLKYQIGSTSDDGWIEYTEPVSTSINQEVYARLFDDTGQYKNTATANINNIDTTPPLDFELAASSTSYSITVSGQTEDADGSIEGTAAENTGVRGYQYKLTDEDGNVIVDWTDETTETTFTFDMDVLNADTGDA